MAANTKAIGLLFEVAGQGSISGETGKLINQQLKDLVKDINSSDKLKLKFSIDSKHIESEIEKIKKQLQSLSSISVSGTRSGGGKGGGAGGASAHSSAWADASNSLKNYYNLLTQLTRAMTRTKDIAFNKESGSFAAPDDSRWKALTEQVNRAKASLDEYTSGAKKSNLTEAEQELLHKKNSAAMQKLQLDTTMFNANGQEAWSNLTAKVHDYISRVEYSASRSPEATQKINELRQMANSTDWRGYDVLKEKLGEVQHFINENSLATETWYQKMKKTFGTRVRSLLAGLSLAKITQSLRDIYKNVVDIDTAMTELKIVTQESDAALRAYSQTAEKTARKIGASISDLIKSTTTYARLGFSLKEAGVFSELTTQYSKVADVSVDDATKNITAIIKAYGIQADELEGVIDKLINVGRNYAISSGEIGEGMNNAASALVANGNTINQALGLLTAANVTSQNISRASTGLRTIAARLSASKVLLDELGEDSSGVETVAKLDDTFRAFGISVTKSNGDLYSTYEILGQIAEKWDDLNDTQRNAIVNLSAGTRQQDIFYSIIQNWKDAKSIVSDVDGSSGELAKATAERLDSIQGKFDQLKATLESLSTNLLESDLVKFFTDFVGWILRVINGVAKITKYMGGFKTVLLGVVSVLLITKSSLIVLNYELTKTALKTAVITFWAKLKTGIIGVIKIIPTAIAAWKAYAAGTITAGAAMQATIPVIGLVLAAVTALVGGLTLAGNLGGKSSEEAREKMREAAQEAKELSAEIYNLTDRYISLSKASEGSNKAQQETIEKQNELRKKLGLTRSELKKLVDQYKTYEKALYHASKAALEDKRRDLRVGIESSEKDLKKMTVSSAYLPLGGYADLNLKKANSEVKHNTYDALMALSEAGYGVSFEGKILEDDDGRYVDKLENLNYGMSSFTDYRNNPNGANAIKVYKEIGDMLSVVEDDVGTDNAIYSWLYTAYRSLEDSVVQYKEDVAALNSNLAEQYLLEARLNGEIPETQDAFNDYRQSIVDAVIATEEYIGTQEDVEDAIDALLEEQKEFSEFYRAVTDATAISLKSSFEILEEVQPAFDALSSMLKETGENGYLTANMLSKLQQLEEDNALGGLKLSEILVEEKDGYKLASDALDKYVESIIAANVAEEAYMTLTDKKNAIANLENLRRVLSTLVMSEDDATDSIKAQKESLKDQLDAYKKLIDLRKKLLKQYEDELSYKKGLEEREKRVAQLQSRLAVSQLDTSAAGRAKTREIANDLREANEDLDDFTLEHAIEVVTNELDEQYEEYESYINEKINELERSVEEIKPTDLSGITSWLKAIAAALDDIDGKLIISEDDNSSGSDNGSGSDGGTNAVRYLTKGSDYSVSGLSPVAMGKDDISVTIDGKKYNAKVSHDKVASPTLEEMYDGSVPDSGTIAVLGDKAYIVRKGAWHQLVEEDSFKIVSAYKEKLNGSNASGEYHSGGIVGDATKLKTTEMFAKLLKGEFVATPQMMKRFMTSTLPELARSGASGGSNEFNAPLISIQCDNVTQESLPGLKEIVEDAVKQIKKQFDDGLGRAGFHKTVKQIV